MSASIPPSRQVFPTHGSLAVVALALAGSDRSWNHWILDGLEVSIVAALASLLT